jgi:hypothetical protein
MVIPQLASHFYEYEILILYRKVYLPVITCLCEGRSHDLMREQKSRGIQIIYIHVNKRHTYKRHIQYVLDQDYEKIRLIRSLKKFIFQYQEFVEIYSVSAETIINDGFSYSEHV